jgi:hypothetical protein
LEDFEARFGTPVTGNLESSSSDQTGFQVPIPPTITVAESRETEAVPVERFEKEQDIPKLLVDDEKIPESVPLEAAGVLDPTHSGQKLPGSPKAEVSGSTTKKQYRKRKRTEPYSLVPLKIRNYNPTEHCGVMDLKLGQPCTRAITCKRHTASEKRLVEGRSHDVTTLIKLHKENFRSLQRGGVSQPELGLVPEPKPEPEPVSEPEPVLADGAGAGVVLTTLPTILVITID